MKTLDDLLTGSVEGRRVLLRADLNVPLEDGRITPYNLDGPNFVAMGRFGNVMLTAGETNLGLSANAGEVVLCDFGGTMAGYCSDITRCVSLGPPPAEVAEAVVEATRPRPAQPSSTNSKVSSPIVT